MKTATLIFAAVCCFFVSAPALLSQCEYGYGQIYMSYWTANGNYRPAEIQPGDRIYLEAYIWLNVADFPWNSNFPVEISTDAGSTWNVVSYVTYLYGPYGDGYSYNYGYLIAEFDVPSSLGSGKECYIRVTEEATSEKECIYTSSYDWYADGPFSILRGCVTPTVFTQPTNVVACEGTSVTIPIDASIDPGYLHYEWYRNNAQFTVTTSPSLNIPNLSADSHEGTWNVKIVDVCGASATTQSFNVTVNKVTAITQQPVSSTVCATSEHTLNVEGDGTDLRFQWFHNGAPIPNATNPSYKIVSASHLSAGTYYVVVSGTCGVPVTSAVVTVTVPPVPTFTAQPQSGTYCSGSTVTLSTQLPPGNYEFQWYKNDTMIADAQQSTFVIPAIAPTDNGFYWVEARFAGTETDGCPSTVRSQRAFISTYGVPAIVQQPQSLDVCEGKSATLFVTAEGADLAYQWIHNGTPIPGATNNVLTIPSVNLNHSGQYQVVIEGMCGFTSNSLVAKLDVWKPPTIVVQPLDKVVDVGDAVHLTVEANDAQDIEWYHNESLLVNEVTNTLILENAQLSEAGYYRAVVRNTCGSVTSRTAHVVVVDPASQLPTISLSTKELNCADVPVGHGVERTFSAFVKNAGNVPVTIIGLTVSGPDAAMFEVTSPVNNIIEKGESLTVTIRFTPSVPGPAIATLTVQSNAQNSDNTATLLGNGVVLYAVDESIDFGIVDKGEKRIQCFTVNNTSATDITISDIQTSGLHPTEFVVTSAIPFVVAAGETQEVCVEFAPQDLGLRNALMTLISPVGGNTSVSLSGTCAIAATVPGDGFLAGMNVYPNPTSGSATIHTGNHSVAMIQVVDVQGNVVRTIHAERNPEPSQSYMISTELLPSGLYTILVTNMEGVYYMNLHVIR